MPPVLHIALQDGFDDDMVVIRVNGAEVFHQDGVATDPRMSLAETYEGPMQEGPVKVEIDLGRRKIHGSVTVQFSGSAYVAVSVEAESIRFKVADQPFGYM